MIDLSIDTLVQKIEEISSGECVRHIEANDSYVLYTYPNKYQFKLADIKEKQTYKLATDDGFPTIEQMEKRLREGGLWTETHEIKSEDLRSKIKGLRVVKDDPSLTKTENRKHILQQSINKYEKELWELEYIKDSKLDETVERKSRRIRYDYLCWLCAFDPFSKDKFWDKSFDEYQIIENILKTEVLTNFIQFIGGHEQEEIRYIARSTYWKVNYLVSQKSNSPLFSRSVYEMTPDQLNLCYWSQFYQNINEMMPEDRPDDETIDNDEALDKWLEEYHRNKSEERKSARLSSFGSSSAMNQKEVLVFRSNPNYEKIEYDEPPSTEGKLSDSDTKESMDKKGMRLRRLIRQKKMEKNKKTD